MNESRTARARPDAASTRARIGVHDTTAAATATTTTHHTTTGETVVTTSPPPFGQAAQAAAGAGERNTALHAADAAAGPSSMVGPGFSGDTAFSAGAAAAAEGAAVAARLPTTFLATTPRDLFSMRVMRLPSPFCLTPASAAAAVIRSAGAAASGPLTAVMASSTIMHNKATELLSPSVTIPLEMGTVYHGELFRACICIAQYDGQPGASTVVCEVGVRIELKTVARTVTLVDTTADAKVDLHVSERLDFVVAQRITERGVHCLTGIITYQDPYTRLKRTFQKAFKFDVKPSLAVSVRVSERGAGLMNIAAVSVQNGMGGDSGSLFIESVKLQPKSSAFAVRSHLVSSSGNITGASLGPGDSHAYMFEFRDTSVAQTSIRATGSSVHGTVNVGAVEVTWRARVGETGIVTVPVSYRPAGITSAQQQSPAMSPLRVVFLNVPDMVVLERPFQVGIAVVNISTTNAMHVQLSLVKDMMTGVAPFEATSLSLGKIEPGERVELSVKLLPLGLGVHRLTGFRIRSPQLRFPIDAGASEQVQVVRVVPE